MMTTPLQHFSSSYNGLSTSAFSTHRKRMTPAFISTPGLDTLAEGSQFALQQLENSRRASASQLLNADKAAPATSSRDAGYAQPSRPPATNRRDSTSAPSRGVKKNANAPVRRRISRACDQCNQLRTKCDGKTPCAHCVEFGLTCEYARERKKRGKASKKDRERAAAQSAQMDGSAAEDLAGAEANSPGNHSSDEAGSPMQTTQDRDDPYAQSHAMPMAENTNLNPLRRESLPSPKEAAAETKPTIHEIQNGYGAGFEADRYGGIQNMQSMLNHSTDQQTHPNILSPQNFDQYQENNLHSILPPNEPTNTALGGFRFGGVSTSPSAFMGLTMGATSPGWLSLPSPSQFPPPIPTHPQPRYPVLNPLIPNIGSIIPLSLACDLLEYYFNACSSKHGYSESPYVVGNLFRKQSFLHPTRPRVCSPALLASMLWVASQTCDAPFLTSSPSSRGRVCQKLLELAVGLLKPLIHGPAPGEASPNYAANMVINGVALGGFGVSMDQLGAESGATGTLDDVATYMHLATVVSASEYKAASLRWWNVAWSMARELKLGRELPPNAPSDGHDSNVNGDMGHGMHSHPAFHNGNFAVPPVSEETREERRRIWWMLYIMDRHLALCYNRPLFLLDKECDGLLQPMSDPQFEAGDWYNRDSYFCATAPHERRRGPFFECTNHSIYGWFTPLMTMLGGCVDLYHARNHPRLGLVFRSSGDSDQQAAEIARQLRTYEKSLKEFEAKHLRDPDHDTVMNQQQGGPLDIGTPSVRSVCSTASRREIVSQTKTVVAYATHIMHVLHILLAGKWDPIQLLDDNDLWISSESFVTTTQHAVDAAEAASDILENDPELSAIPYFFGIYLLQGSFLLLLIADKLQGDASPDVVRACETVVRAHEACVVTLNTEYQRNFRKVMRSALSQIRGRIPEDFGEEQQRRREVLSLYRWKDDGTGLAL